MGISLSCWSRRFDCNTASLHQAMRSIVYVSLFVAWWFAAIGAFRSSLLFRLLDVVLSQVRFVVGRLLCFRIVGIQASGISIPLSLLMLFGWSLIWIASLTLRVYQWGSRSINLTFFQIGRCPVSSTIRPHRLMKTSIIAVETSRSTAQSDSIVRQTNERSPYSLY